MQGRRRATARWAQWWAVAAGGLAGGRAGQNDQVRKKSAEPDKILVLVSRFLFFPIQNHFFGKRSVHQNPPSHGAEPSGVGGYMRKRKAKPPSSQLMGRKASLLVCSPENSSILARFPLRGPLYSLVASARSRGIIAVIDPPSSAASGQASSRMPARCRVIRSPW